ncbi:MAG: hypothetical protein ACLFVW_02950 [Phycisphaerae bacterium]
MAFVRTRQRAASRAGLTLLEVILALALTVGLAGAVMGFYHRSASLRDSLLEEVNFVAAERAFMDLITSELRSAEKHGATDTALEGGEMRMQLVTHTLPGPAAWAAVNITEQATPAERELRLVGYRVCDSEDETAQPTVCGIERTEQRRLAAQVAEEGEEISVELLTEDIRFLRLRYWDGSAWITAWSGSDLPVAVEVTLGRRPLPEDTTPEDYPYETFTRVVHIPGSRAQLGERTNVGFDSGGGW